MRRLVALGAQLCIFSACVILSPNFQNDGPPIDLLQDSEQSSLPHLLYTYNSSGSLNSWNTRATPALQRPLTNYTTKAFVETTNQTVIAKTKLNYVNSASVPLKEIILHIYANAFRPEGYIVIKSVTHRGENLTYHIFGSDSTLLNISLVNGGGPGALSTGGNVTLDLCYYIKVPNKMDRFGWFHTDSPELWIYNMGNWHPIASVYDERGWDTAPYVLNYESFHSEVATYDVRITMPQGWVVAATGELHSVIPDSEDVTWHWVTGPVRDFVWCASPNFKTTSISTSGVNITSYHILNHSSRGQDSLEIAGQCLDVFGGLFGPYPWPSLRIVETVFGALGMEYPQLIMVASSLHDNVSESSKFERVIVHEIGHQWIPFAIGTNSYAEPWIDEGFASYTELVYAEHVYGPEQRKILRNAKLDSYRIFVGEWGDDRLNRSMEYWETNPGYVAIVYDKASLVLDMLRNQIGDSTFYDGWKHIYQQALHKNIDAADLQHLFEEAMGGTLDWYFDPWVFGEGEVLVDLENASVYLGHDEWGIDFQLRQGEESPISLRIPIHIVTLEGSEDAWVQMAPSTLDNHTVWTSSQPVWLNLDPEDLSLVKYGSRSLSLLPSPALGTVESCDQQGNSKDIFDLNETVYINGTGFLPSTTYDVYVFTDSRWMEGVRLPEGILQRVSKMSSDVYGTINPTPAWSQVSMIGKYDIIVDINRNRHFDEGIDAIDDNDSGSTAGFSVPEGQQVWLLLVIIFTVLTIIDKREVLMQVIH